MSSKKYIKSGAEKQRPQLTQQRTAQEGSNTPPALQLVKKGLAEFRVRRRESSIIRFLPRHVRGGKHFARSERRIVRFQRTTEAQTAAKLSRKSGNATFSTDTGRALTLPVSSACQRSLAIVQAFWYNGEKEDRREEEWNSGNRITGETW